MSVVGLSAAKPSSESNVLVLTSPRPSVGIMIKKLVPHVPLVVVQESSLEEDLSSLRRKRKKGDGVGTGPRITELSTNDRVMVLPLTLFETDVPMLSLP